MSKIQGSTHQLQVNMQQTAKTRQTKNDSFGQKLKDTAQAIGQGASMAAAYLPGGSVISAALSSVAGGGGGAGSSIGSGSSALTAAGGAGGAAGAVGNNAGGGGSAGSSGLPGVNTNSGPLSNAHQMMKDQAALNVQMLSLQSQMQNESRGFQTVSNILKNRQDSAKNSIRNIN